MTATFSAGASKADGEIWKSAPWVKIEASVWRLQMRIAKAVQKKQYGKVKSLQWLLTHSLYAKYMAVKRVTSSLGSKTAGIDGEICQTPKQKMQLVKSMQRRGYVARPLRRVYIPKKNGKMRPLGIPTIRDRAMQALHLLSVEPIAEITADPNSYGFRSQRSTADAIEQCFRALSHKGSAQWILEADICKCFDCINHNWLEENVLMDKTILCQWLKAGYIERQKLYPTREGTPQGGVISPTLANIALNALEQSIKKITAKSDKVHIIRYADDFVVTGNSKELLEQKVKPAIEAFLLKRGLVLSKEKTKITHISEGFDLLGFQVRKYGSKLLIKPSKASIKKFLENIRKVIKANCTADAVSLIKLLNLKIRGWAYYYRHVVAKDTFGYVDNSIYLALARWAKRRHPNKNRLWLRNKYFRSQSLRHWIFAAKDPKENGRYLDLYKAQSLPIKRHVKIISQATPYDVAFREYFMRRELLKRRIPTSVMSVISIAQL